MIVKNWEAIAKIENDDLRRLLCNSEDQYLLKFLLSIDFGQLIDLMQHVDFRKVDFGEYLTEDSSVQDTSVQGVLRDTSMSIEDLAGLSGATYYILKRNEIYTVDDILKHSKKSFLDIHKIGKVRFNEVNSALQKNGFRQIS